MTKLEVTMWPVDRPIPYARNARKISEKAVDKVAASIQEFGFRQPIVVDKERVVVVGHVRLLAARKLGLTEVPVHVAENLSPAQIKAYRLMDNRSHEETDWDYELLGRELQELKDLECDLVLSGFDSPEIDRLLLDSDADERADAVPEVPENPVSRAGDVWLMGEHRLLFGDATKMADVEKVLAGELADMTFCDPPYNVDYEGKTAKKLRIGNDAMGGQFYEFLRESCANVLAVTKGAAYICVSSSELHTLHRAFTDAGGHWSTFVIWAKHHFTLGRSDYQRQYEPMLYGWRDGVDHFWCGARDQGDVWFIKRPLANTEHPTIKPVELVERAVRNSSKTRDTILDPFGGSGTTLIACEKEARKARLIELEPKYCDVIVRRWQEYTGRQAALEATGELFNDRKAVAAEPGKC